MITNDYNEIDFVVMREREREKKGKYEMKMQPISKIFFCFGFMSFHVMHTQTHTLAHNSN